MTTAAERWLQQWVAALERHDVDALAQLVTDDVAWEDPAMRGAIVRGKAQLRAFAEASLRAFPDIGLQIVGSPLTAGSDQRLAIEWEITGTFTGPMAWTPPGEGARPVNLAPTGRRVTASGMDVYELRDGRLSRWVVFYDLLAVSVALGLAPPPDGALARFGLRFQPLVASVQRRRSAARAE